LSTTTLLSEKDALKKTPQAFPFLDLRAQFASIRQETIDAVTRVLESQAFILGEEVDSFEKEIAQFVGCQFVIGCASGSDALLLALMALGIGVGDEVVTTPFTFVATGTAIARLGARPVFVDIDPETFNIDTEALENAITPRTRAILPVHLFGLPADMNALKEVSARHGLAVIEDAAQAIGARYRDDLVGQLGTIACFSFFPSKNLGGAGDGGMLTTNDAAYAERLRLLRVHGNRTKYSSELLGINSRLDAMQAAILRVKLRHLDDWTTARRRNAARYRQLFLDAGLEQKVKAPEEPAGSHHVYNQFVIRASRRDELQAYLRARGIPSEIYYPNPLHLQPAFAYLGHDDGNFPQSERASREVLALPISPELTEEQQTMVVNAMADYYNSYTE